MSTFLRSLALAGALAFVGCEKPAENKLVEHQTEATQKQDRNTAANTAGTQKKRTVKRTKKTVEPPPQPIAQVPPVVMSEQERSALKVFQNDTLSANLLDQPLAGLDGKSHTLRSELGNKLTVVLFWSSDHAYSAEELHYLATRAAHEFGTQGVKIVTINQHDDRDQANKAAGNAGASSLVTLLDTNKALSQLANGSVPRTYLLDSAGRVLWLDIVFDRTTQRDLNGAIDFVLSKS